MSLFREIRYAARRWSRSPALAAVVALSLALGLGVNAAIFGVLRGVVLAPYDLPELDRLVAVTRQNPAQGRTGWPLPPQEFRDWRATATSFTGMAAHQPSSTTLTADGEAIRLSKSNVTSNFFDVLGRPVALGRAPTEAETAPDGPAVVVLGYELWRTRFGADPGIVGRTITLDGTETEVVGVADERFAYPEGVDLWTALQLGEELARSRTFHTLHTVGRLADGVSVEAALTELTGITERLEQAYPDTNEGERAGVQPLADAGLGNVARGLAAVFLGAGMVLLLTALNVAVLFFARSLEGSRETAIRAAMGASRKQVVAPVVADAVLLGASALALGVPVAAALLATVRNGAGSVLPHTGRIGLDAGTVGLVVVLTAVASVACSAVPALRAFRAGTGALGRERTLARPGSARARKALIATEMTLALVTLVGAGLLLRTFVAYAAVDRGMDDGEGIVFTVSLPGAQYPAGSESVRMLFEGLYERIGALRTGSRAGPWGPPSRSSWATRSSGRRRSSGSSRTYR